MIRSVPVRGLLVLRRARFPAANTARFVSALSSTEFEDVDIAIVGSGVAGAALACALANDPALGAHSIALIDANEIASRYTPDEGEFSNRVVSLAPRAVEFLDKLGAWERIPASRRNGYTDMRVWDACGGGQVSFSASTIGAPALAHMVELSAIRSALLDALPSRVRTFAPATLTTPIRRDSEQSDNFPVLDLTGSSSSSPIAMRARLVLGADGAASPVRQHLMPSHTAFFGRDYGASGLVATVAVEALDGNATAWQRFLPTGTLAMLPLDCDTSSLVWSLPRDLALKLRGLPAADFTALVNAAFFYPPDEVEVLLRNPTGATDLAAEIEWRDTVHETESDLGSAVLPPHVLDVADASRAAFPLRVRHASSYVGDRVAILGDAAHLIHPLAGQGLNLGLSDAESLARTISAAAQSGLDVGHPHALDAYPAERYAANAAMLTACDGLHHLFATENAAVAWTRSFGLNRFNAWDAAKRRAMAFAMGK
ncbi:hypothetical protein BC828DRAFT_382149 [Blastocladiella britannica]|nr:hypothetical protein BC828DRAFT_382149 [Blastocladiella britannica]